MEFNGIVLLALLWFLVSFLSRSRKSSRPPPWTSTPTWPPAEGERLGGDATQEEGRRLELVLRDFQRALEQAGSSSRPTRLPPPKQVERSEEGSSLEIEPEVTSLE